MSLLNSPGVIPASPVSGASGVLPVFSDFGSADSKTRSMLNPETDYWSKSHTDYDGPPRTKIICTIGPKTKNPEMLKKLMKAGMNVVRLNFSHGTHEYHAEVVKNTRKVEHESKKLCGVMLDTKGPEIRTGLLKNEKGVRLEEGQEFMLTTDSNILGDNTRVGVLYKNLAKVLNVGNVVLIDDGLISMTVISKTTTTVTCLVENSGVLGQQKGVNLPGVVVDLPAVTQKDVRDIKFGVEMGVDFIAASFVRKAADVHTIREILGERGKQIQIISKIENQEGLENFDEILSVSDGIMVARGDLGVEIPIERVVLAQKLMIRKCNSAGKIVITATQMLESMCENPSPTRAEASDVANAVYDGTDCVMLSGETAKGNHPVLAVQMMSDICKEAEQSINYVGTFQSIHDRSSHYALSIPEAIASSAVKTAFDLRAAVVVVVSASGKTARFVSKYRPSAPILMLTDSEQVARQSLVSRGVFPLLVGSTTGARSLISRAIQIAKAMRMCRVGDCIVVATGHIPGSSLHGDQKEDSNVLRVLTVRY